jgi:hypothetical protein
MKTGFTEKEKRHARKMLLEIANCYEVKKKKVPKRCFLRQHGRSMDWQSARL